MSNIILPQLTIGEVGEGEDIFAQCACIVSNIAWNTKTGSTVEEVSDLFYQLCLSTAYSLFAENTSPISEYKDTVNAGLIKCISESSAILVTLDVDDSDYEHLLPVIALAEWRKTNYMGYVTEYVDRPMISSIGRWATSGSAEKDEHILRLYYAMRMRSLREVNVQAHRLIEECNLDNVRAKWVYRVINSIITGDMFGNQHKSRWAGFASPLVIGG